MDNNVGKFKIITSGVNKAKMTYVEIVELYAQVKRNKEIIQKNATILKKDLANDWQIVKTI